MANTVVDTNPTAVLNLNGTTYSLKDAWARAEIAEIEAAIAGGVRFGGVTTTQITDNEELKELTVGGNTIPVASQTNGTIYIYNNGTKNIEFIVCNGHYSEFGTTGELGALAFADTASGSVEIPIAAAITFNPITPQVGLGTLSVTTGTDTISVTTTSETASGTFSPSAITIAASTVTLTPTKGTFTALKDVTYDSNTATLTLTNGTSDEFWKSATGVAAGQTVTPAANQSISVTYQKATASSKTFLTSAALSGALSITASTPTATITNPTVTVTVSPVSD